jgi:hypothetical protein
MSAIPSDTETCRNFITLPSQATLYKQYRNLEPFLILSLLARVIVFKLNKSENISNYGACFAEVFPVFNYAKNHLWSLIKAICRP